MADAADQAYPRPRGDRCWDRAWPAVPPPLRWSALAQTSRGPRQSEALAPLSLPRTPSCRPPAGQRKGRRAPAIGASWVPVGPFVDHGRTRCRPDQVQRHGVSFLVGLAILLLLSAAAVAIFIAGEVGVAPTNPQERPGLVPAPASSRGSRLRSVSCCSAHVSAMS